MTTQENMKTNYDNKKCDAMLFGIWKNHETQCFKIYKKYPYDINL